MEEAGQNIHDIKSGRRWNLDAAPTMALPEELGVGGVRLLGMHGGFLFCSVDCCASRSAEVHLTDPSAPEDRVSLMALTSLNGTLKLKPGGFRRPLEVDQGRIAIFPSPEPVMTLELAPEHQRGINTGFSRKLLQRVGEEIPLPANIRRLAERHETKPFVVPGRIDQRFGMLLQELVHNPYTNGASRIYQEAKGLELIAMLAHAMDQRKTSSRTQWKRRDVELLEEARRRLVSVLDEPPSLMELARTLGISTTRLKRGFREVFGTTVTATLSEARLNLARQLLEQGELPLKAIAPQCGFSDAASLSHAFIRRFGIPPGRARQR